LAPEYPSSFETSPRVMWCSPTSVSTAALKLSTCAARRSLNDAVERAEVISNGQYVAQSARFLPTSACRRDVRHARRALHALQPEASGGGSRLRDANRNREKQTCAARRSLFEAAGVCKMGPVQLVVSPALSFSAAQSSADSDRMSRSSADRNVATSSVTSNGSTATRIAAFSTATCGGLW
jgi:hypothetical protein